MQTLKVTQWRAAAFISLFLLAAASSTASSSNEQQHKLTAADESAIRATIEAYRTAWLANDAKGVLKTFTDDAVLLPAHGAPAIVGIAAIEKYWFTPGGPPTTITELNITVDQARGNGAPAYARGLDSVALDGHSGGYYTPPLPSRNLPQRDEETARQFLANPGAHV